MLAIAGGIILAWFVLAFLPQLLWLTWQIIRIGFFLAVIGTVIAIYIGSW